MHCCGNMSSGMRGYSSMQSAYGFGPALQSPYDFDTDSPVPYNTGSPVPGASYSQLEKKAYAAPQLTKIDVIKMYGVDNSPDKQYSAAQLAGPSTYSQLVRAGEGAAQPLYIGPALFFGGGGLMHRRGPLYMGGKNGIGAGYSGAGCSAGKGSAAAGSSGGK